jgi:hypothetical protein
MKKASMKIFSIIFIAFILINSCTKSNVENFPITGSWELRESIGGFAGDVKYNPGNGNIFQFNSDMTFKILDSATTIVTGKYQIIKLFGNDKNLLHLKYDSATYSDVTDSVKIENDKLIFSTQPQCCDIPYATIYERLN